MFKPNAFNKCFNDHEKRINERINTQYSIIIQEFNQSLKMLTNITIDNFKSLEGFIQKDIDTLRNSLKATGVIEDEFNLPLDKHNFDNQEELRDKAKKYSRLQIPKVGENEFLGKNTFDIDENVGKINSTKKDNFKQEIVPCRTAALASLKDLCAKDVNFLRKHASSHNIPNSSRIIKSLVIEKLVQHYKSRHNFDLPSTIDDNIEIKREEFIQMETYSISTTTNLDLHNEKTFVQPESMHMTAAVKNEQYETPLISPCAVDKKAHWTSQNFDEAMDNGALFDDDFIIEMTEGLPPGWKKRMKPRQGGLSAGRVDINIYNTKGKLFRTKNELIKYTKSNPEECKGLDISIAWGNST